MLLLHSDGGIERPRLGPDLVSGARPLAVVEPGTWMGAKPLGDWSLVATTMAPPYDPAGFELGDEAGLLSVYGDAAEEIRRLAR